jgi:hypothetical protein
MLVACGIRIVLDAIAVCRGNPIHRGLDAASLAVLICGTPIGVWLFKDVFRYPILFCARLEVHPVTVTMFSKTGAVLAKIPNAAIEMHGNNRYLWCRVAPHAREKLVIPMWMVEKSMRPKVLAAIGSKPRQETLKWKDYKD